MSTLTPSMPTSADLLSSLINTYRTLNMTVRPRPDAELRARSAGGPSIRDIVTRMRDDELRFSQALKERISGVPMPEFLQDETPVIGTETEGDSTAVIIAQFGTARESTLAMLRSLPEEEWDTAGENLKSIRQRIMELIESDQRHLQRLSGMLPATAGAAT
jgi:hypothetical protein